MTTMLPSRVEMRLTNSILTVSCSQVRQGIANNTKGTAFVVYEDVTDAKQACDKLNGFNFQNRYLVGTSFFLSGVVSIPRLY